MTRNALWFWLVCAIQRVHSAQGADPTANWAEEGATPPEASNACSALVLKSLSTTVKNNKYNLLVSNPRESKDVNVECAIDNNSWKWTGDFQLYVEVYLTDTAHLPTRIEISNKNDREGIFTSFVGVIPDSGRWREGWNTIRIPLTDRTIKHASITDWKKLVHFQVYRSGDQTLDTEVEKQILFRNFWFLSMSKTLRTITSTTTTTTDHTTTPLPDCSVQMLDYAPSAVAESRWSVLDEFVLRDGFDHDIACAIDTETWQFDGHYEFQADVWIDDETFYPTNIELTNENNREGIVSSFNNAYPRPKWKSKSWHSVKIPISDKNLRHANETTWEKMTRLEFYRSKPEPNYDASMGVIGIIFRHFNFVKVADAEPHSDNDHFCTKEIIPERTWTIKEGKDYLYRSKHMSADLVPFDMSCAVDAISSSLTANYQISFDFWLEDERFFPTRFELMNENDKQGIIVDIGDPEGGWKTQTWQRLYIPLSYLDIYDGIDTDWTSLKHFQVYVNKGKDAAAKRQSTDKQIRTRNVWLLGSGDLVEPPTTTTTTTDPKATAASLPTCSWNLVDWFYNPVTNAKYNIMYTFLNEVNGFIFDLSCLIDSQTWTLADNFEFQADVWITDPKYTPETIELTNKNDEEGIMAKFSEAIPSPEKWGLESWTSVRVPLDDSNVRHANATDWLRMTRLQLYRTGNEVLSRDPDFVAGTIIKIRNLNLVRIVTTTTTTTATTTTVTTTTTTKAACGAGEYRDVSSNACKDCPRDTYRPERSHSFAECSPHSTCDDDEFESEPATPSSNVVCRTSRPCSSFEWESTPPVGGSNERECTRLTTCVEGEYVKEEATVDSDRQCAPCDSSDDALAGGLCTTTSTTTSFTTTTTSTTVTTSAATTKTGTTDRERASDSSPAASGANKKGGGSNTTVLIVAVVAVLVAVIVAAVFVVRRRQSPGDAGAIVSFENPAYASAPAPVVGPAAGQGLSSGYMDVGPNGGNGADITGGYMDVGGAGSGNFEDDLDLNSEEV